MTAVLDIYAPELCFLYIYSFFCINQTFSFCKEPKLKKEQKP